MGTPDTTTIPPKHPPANELQRQEARIPLEVGLSDYSYAAARAAECAGEQGRFWPFHRELLADTNWFAIERFAVTAGIRDMDAFDACLADESPVTFHRK